jgi:hypothetical protein
MTVPMTNCVVRMSSRLLKRSAIVPPMGLSKSIATPWPNMTVPTALLLPVRSKATTL